jgi:nucleoside-diphosphate-sugar epimerase
MKAVVIGGTGHVGGYLVPRLLALGYEVACVSRGGHQPYQDNAAWKRVSMVSIDRTAEEQAGTFGTAIAALAPDVVVDMICFSAASGRQLAEALRGRVLARRDGRIGMAAASSVSSTSSGLGDQGQGSSLSSAAGRRP